jgi:hypothetical protein
MTASNVRHELDDSLAGATMFSWYAPMFRLAFKHWALLMILGVAALGLDWLLGRVPWPHYAARWWVQLLSGYVEFIAYSGLILIAYRFLVERENVGIVNDWPVMLIRAIQIQTLWFVAICVIVLAIALLSSLFAVVGRSDNIYAMLQRGRLFLVLKVGIVLLMPVWFSLMVAAALSDVYSVRSSESAFVAVPTSLRLAFDQKWRVFWPSYALFVIFIVSYAGVVALEYSVPLLIHQLFPAMTTFLTTVLAVPMTFVIERAYAPHLTKPDADLGDAHPSHPSPGAASPPRIRKPLAPEVPLPTAPSDIGHRLADDLRSNRMQRLVETVENGLKANAEFFVAHPDESLAVAKRLATVQRPDLALRIAQPYLKNHRGHRQHLTVALYVANLLLRDLNRKADAARFLGQVRSLYPNEPMVIQLIKITDKAIAEGGSTP